MSRKHIKFTYYNTQKIKIKRMKKIHTCKLQHHYNTYTRKIHHCLTNQHKTFIGAIDPLTHQQGPNITFWAKGGISV